MKRKETNIDEILKRYLPHSSNQEIESARDRFLLLLRERHELQEALDNFRTPGPVTKSEFVTLGYVDQLVLTAIYLLRGEGTSLGIADKVNELTAKIFDTGQVFVSLDRLERGRLISSRSVDAQRQGDDPKVVFKITAEGEQMLAEVRAAAKQLMDALEDFAWSH